MGTNSILTAIVIVIALIASAAYYNSSRYSKEADDFFRKHMEKTVEASRRHREEANREVDRIKNAVV